VQGVDLLVGTRLHLGRALHAGRRAQLVLGRPVRSSMRSTVISTWH
jgi:hypothetical protein